MADSAFPTGAYPAYTTEQLKEWVQRPNVEAKARQLMQAEIERRAARDAGQVEAMTAAERLRHARSH